MTTTTPTSVPFDGETVSSLAVSQLQRVSWGAVIAGMVMAVVVQLVLGLIGTGVGLSTLDPMRYGGSPDAATLGLGAGIWWIVSSVIALFVGGWVAGHLSGSAITTDAVLHGLLAWGLATMVTVYLVASLVGSAIRGGAAVVAKTADVAAAGVGAVAGLVTDIAKSQLAASGISIHSLTRACESL